MPAAHPTMLGASAGVQPRRSRRRPDVSHRTSITMELPVREDVVGNGDSDADLGIFADGYFDAEQGEQQEHVAISKVAPERQHLIGLALEATEEDQCRLFFRQGNMAIA